jgi:tape measure domain-containing protein
LNIGELWLKLGVKEDSSLKKTITNLHKMGDVAGRVMGELGSAARANASAFAQLGGVSTRVSAAMGAAAKKAAVDIRSASVSNSHAMKNAAQDASLAADKVVSSYKRMARAAASGGKGGMSFAGLVGRGGRSAINWGGVGDPFDPGGQKSAMAVAAAQAATWSTKGGRGAGNFALDQMNNDLNAPSGSRGFGKGNWALAHMAAQRGTSDREYVATEGDSPPDMSVPKRRGWFGRYRDALSSQGAGGGGKGPGFLRRAFGGGEGGRRGGYGRDNRGVLGQTSTLRRIIMGAGIIQGAQEFGQLADTYAQLQMRLNGLTGSQEKTNEVFERLRGISRDTKSSLESTTEGYVRLRNATATMNLSEEDSFKLMTNLNTMLVTSGASTAEAASGMRQLTQAFAKGKLDGDEFKSIAENMPNILKELGKSLGKTEGQLREMSENGELTREKLVKMLLAVKNLNKPVDTFASAWQRFKDDLMVSFGVIAKENHLVENFAAVLKIAGEVLTQQIVPALATVFKWLKEHENVTKALVIAGLASLFFNIGKSLLSFPFTVLFKLIDAYKSLAKWATAAKIATAGGPGAAGAGAMGASAGTSAAGGVASRVGAGALVAGGGVVAGLAGLAVGSYALNKHLESTANMQALANVTGKSASMSHLPSWAGGSSFVAKPGGGGNSVSIGEVKVTIQANDMTDAQQKFGTEMDKILRQTAFAR